ncbi:MAG TPA: cupin domain-containing protein [Planctomycetes bacterium]|nr:cupin domain-containing protein [Planctomycetota bacterium]
MTEAIDLKTKLSVFEDAWHPRIIGEANGQYLKLAKAEGHLEWHTHEEEDEVFLCLEGCLVLEMRDSEVTLEPGQLFVMPRGVEHRPRAEPTASILLLEPKQTQHLGKHGGPRAIDVEEQEWI